MVISKTRSTLCGVAMIMILGVGTADSRTQPDTMATIPDTPGQVLLADFLEQDPLGYECIPEDRIDAAFFASGKGLRLPQTCLPEPCDAALSPLELASLIGRPPYASEWDTYFARYSDYCRKEVIAFDGASDEATDAPSGRDPVAAFWAPLLPAGSPGAARLPGRIRGFPGLAAGGLPTLVGGPSPVNTAWVAPDIVPLPGAVGGPGEQPGTPIQPGPTPVPLPGTAALLATALVGLGAAGRRRARKRAFSAG